MHYTGYLHMLKYLVPISFVITITLTVNPYLILQVNSSSESSSLSPEGSGDDDESDGTGETNGSSNESGDDGDESNDNDGISQTDDQKLESDDDVAVEEPPRSDREIGSTPVPKPDYPLDCPSGTYFNIDSSRGKECLPCIPDVDPHPACSGSDSYASNNLSLQEHELANQTIGNTGFQRGDPIPVPGIPIP